MELKILKPTTSSKRGSILLNKSLLWKGKPIKKLTKGLKQMGGRNRYGKISIRHRGGAHKKNYRTIVFKKIPTCFGKVHTIEYDPKRSAFIYSMLQKETGALHYFLSAHNLKVGDFVYTGLNPPKITLGSFLPLKKIPVGSLIFNLQINELKKTQYIKAAGTCGKLLRKSESEQLVEVLLASGERKTCNINCYASIGSTSNRKNFLIKLGKAGRSRWLGKRPSVRGTAMNPVDHPLGGGNGKSCRGPSRTPWGKPAKNYPTRKKKKQR